MTAPLTRADAERVARTLHRQKMSAARISEYLGVRGYPVSPRQVARLVDPVRERAKDTRRKRDARLDRRVLVLREAGLSFEAISTVMRLYHGEARSAEAWARRAARAGL